MLHITQNQAIIFYNALFVIGYWLSEVMLTENKVLAFIYLSIN